MLTKRASNLVRGLHQQPHAHEWLARDPYSADSYHLQPDTFYEPRLTQVFAAWNHHFRTHFRHNPHHFREEHVFPPCWSYDHTHNALLKKLTHQRSSWTAVIRREILNLTLCSCCRSFLSKSVKILASFSSSYSLRKIAHFWKMEASSDSSNPNEWELSKENVQPLKQGRKLANLTAAFAPSSVDQSRIHKEKR